MIWCWSWQSTEFPFQRGGRRVTTLGVIEPLDSGGCSLMDTWLTLDPLSKLITQASSATMDNLTCVVEVDNERFDLEF